MGVKLWHPETPGTGTRVTARGTEQVPATLRQLQHNIVGLKQRLGHFGISVGILERQTPRALR